MGKPWTPGQNAEFLRLVVARKTSDQIAAEMGLPRVAIHRAATRHKVKLFNPHEWTPEAIDLLKTYLGSHKAKYIAQLINQKLGTEFSTSAVHAETQRIKIKARRNTGDYIVTDAAKEIGITDDQFKTWARRNGIRTWRSGNHVFVTIEDVDKMRRVFADPPEPCVSAKQAARRLGITVTALRGRNARGTMRTHKRGWELLIPVAEVERIERERRH